MEEKGRFVLKCVLLLLICIVCGGILITAVNFLPVNRERKSASLAEIAEAVRAYLLELEPVGNDGKVFLWVTNQGRMPLAEYGEAVMGGEKLQGQMLSRIEYWCGLRDPSMRILYTVTFLGICMGALYFCQSVMGEERYEIYGGDGVPEPGR